jgi:hypothetical protein
MALASPAPRSLQQIGNELVFVWPDGREDYLSLERLRRECPCAMCRGEGDLLGRIHKPPRGRTGSARSSPADGRRSGLPSRSSGRTAITTASTLTSLLRKLGEATQTA